MCCQVTTQTHVSAQVTPRPWEAPSTPPARFQLAAHPRAHRCRLGPEGPHWMVLTRRLWGSRTGAQLPSTRTSCTSSERRSWPIRCWPGGSPCPTTCRWPCRASGRCPGCSHRCQLYLHPPCLQQGPGPALDQHLQITAGLTVGPTAPGTWDGEGSQSQPTGMWTCVLALPSIGFPGTRAAVVINGVSPAPLSTLVPTPRGSLWDVSPGARAARGGGRVQGRVQV